MARGAMKRRRIYPMPIEPLIDHPVAMTLGPAPFGALCRLCLHFYATECRELPPGEHEIRQIARAHGPTWRANREAILGAFADIRPTLERAYRDRITGRDTLRIAARRANDSAKARAAIARLEAHSSPQSVLPTAPVREPERPPTARQQARDSAPAGAFADRA